MANPKYEAFLTIAHTGSFKQAATDLGYTQAGISYLISSLEKEFGMTLFVRDYGETILSADGRELLPWIQKVCTDERQLSSRVAELKHLESGLVRVAAFTSTSIQWFPGIAKRFLQLYPNIDLKLICNDDELAVGESVWNGEADCAFFVLPTKRNLYAIPLKHDPLYVVVSPDHPLANAEYFPKRALAEEPYIQLMSNSRPSEMNELFAANGVTPNVRFTVDSDYAVMSMVSAGLGFSVLPDLILHNPPFPLAILSAEVETSREIAIAIRSPEIASAATKAFLEVTEQWVAENAAADLFD